MLDKSRIALLCILGMFAGFLFSRVAMSISMFFFGLNAIRDIPPRQWLRQKWWLLGLAWVAVYALTWFWSEDKGEWGNHLQTKLPFLLLPLAFSYQPKFSAKEIQFFTLSVAVMLLIGAGYTIGCFLADPHYYISEYKVSHMLPTLPKRDHIRSSMASALFIVWAIYAWPQLTDKRIKGLVATCILLLVAYIHILAAKSGLLSFYLFVGAWGIYMSFGKRKIVGLMVIIAIPITVMLAAKLIPTLRERITYIGFTIFMYNHHERTDNLGDVARITSYKLSSELIKQNPLNGTGTGDMKHEMDRLYLEKYPQIAENGRLLPHNQFLTVALGCGIPAMLIFMVWVVAPLAQIRRNRQSFFFFIVWFLLLIQLMIEPALETQYGVFIYLFFLLLHLQELQREASPNLSADR